ncbi:hypothetical protein BDV59DRAFT_205043 [Aspergillus ambiguus]|uniref:uncharacterized protein n=1 Tax=Aspergillus ambiguus TaxID=176160 RepID=UPI003CCDE69C
MARFILSIYALCFFLAVFARALPVQQAGDKADERNPWMDMASKAMQNSIDQMDSMNDELDKQSEKHNSGDLRPSGTSNLPEVPPTPEHAVQADEHEVEKPEHEKPKPEHEEEPVDVPVQKPTPTPEVPISTPTPTPDLPVPTPTPSITPSSVPTPTPTPKKEKTPGLLGLGIAGL